MRTTWRPPALSLLTLCGALLFPAGAQATVNLRPLRPRRCAAAALRPRDGAPASRRPGAGHDADRLCAASASDRRRPSLGTIVAVDGGPATPRPRPPMCARWPPPWRRCCAAAIWSSSTSAGPAARGAIDCPPLQRGLIRKRSRSASARTSSAPLRRLHHGRSRRRPRRGARRPRADKIFFYGDSYGTLLGQAYAVRYPSRLRGLILDSAYPADDPYYRTLLPAGAARAGHRLPPLAELRRQRGRPLPRRRPALPRRRPLDRGPARLPARSRARWRRAPTSASTKATVASLPATRAASTG